MSAHPNPDGPMTPPKPTDAPRSPEASRSPDAPDSPEAARPTADHGPPTDEAPAHEPHTGSLGSLPERKSDALNRIRTAIGHAKAVERMVEEDRYCIDVLKQIAAVQAQLGKVAHLVTRSHMELCLRHAIEEGEGQAHIDELAEALRYLGATRADSG